MTPNPAIDNERPRPAPGPDGDIRRAVRLGLAGIVLGILGMVVWAVAAPLSGAIVALGTVKVDLNHKTVQHLEGGIVTEVLVRDGQHVTAGQPLVLLGDVAVSASVDALQVQLASERLKAARLEAEQTMRGTVAFPRDLPEQARDSRISDLRAREQALFASRQRALDDRMGLLRRQIGEAKDEVAALERQIEAESGALQLQREELASNEALVSQGYVTNTRILTLRRAVAEYESRQSEHRSELAKSRQKITDLELRVLALRNDHVEAAAGELKETLARIHELEQRIRPAIDAQTRQQIVAPVSGEVVNLKFTAPGTIVGPRDAILDIVPDDPRLVIEARIRPEDVSHVARGSAVDIRFTSFKYRTTPLVAGKVFYLSADRLVDRVTNQSYYSTLIEADPRSLAAAGNLPIQAGMPAEVFVRTEPRSLVDYLLEPVTGFLRRAMREP